MRALRLTEVTLTAVEGDKTVCGRHFSAPSWDIARGYTYALCAHLPTDLQGYIKCDVEATFDSGERVRTRFDASPFGEHHEGTKVVEAILDEIRGIWPTATLTIDGIAIQ